MQPSSFGGAKWEAADEDSDDLGSDSDRGAEVNVSETMHPVGLESNSIPDNPLARAAALQPLAPLAPGQQSSSASSTTSVAQNLSVQQSPAELGHGLHMFDRLEGVDLPDYVKTHDKSLTFPQKLMLMLIHVEREYSQEGRNMENAPIAWILRGKAFIIRHRDPLVHDLLPLFFQHAKFSSFTRKLYRWGFRQVNLPRDVIQQDYRELVFGNPNFQRDNKALMSRMVSITAARRRRMEEKQRRAEEVKGESQLPADSAGVARAVAPPMIAAQSLMGSALAPDNSLALLGAYAAPRSFHSQILQDPQPLLLQQALAQAVLQQTPTIPPTGQLPFSSLNTAATQRLLALSHLQSRPGAPQAPGLPPTIMPGISSLTSLLQTNTLALPNAGAVAAGMPPNQGAAIQDLLARFPDASLRHMQVAEQQQPQGPQQLTREDPPNSAGGQPKDPPPDSP